MTIHLLDHRAAPGAIARNTIRSRAERLLALLGLSDRELSLVLCDDEEIQELNKSWRKKDKATDVLSFPQDDEQVLGDVVLSIETAIRQSTDADGWARAHALEDAPDRAWGPLDETTLLLIHGVLHLLGHDHHKKAEAQKMRAEEARLFSLLTQRAAPRKAAPAKKSDQKTAKQAPQAAAKSPEKRAPKKAPRATTPPKKTAKAAPTEKETAKHDPTKTAKKAAPKGAAPKERAKKPAAETRAPAPEKRAARAAQPTPKTRGATRGNAATSPSKTKDRAATPAPNQPKNDSTKTKKKSAAKPSPKEGKKRAAK